jgi:hypothetical protein
MQPAGITRPIFGVRTGAMRAGLLAARLSRAVVAAEIAKYLVLIAVKRHRGTGDYSKAV